MNYFVSYAESQNEYDAMWCERMHKKFALVTHLFNSPIVSHIEIPNGLGCQIINEVLNNAQESSMLQKDHTVRLAFQPFGGRW